MLFVQLSKVSKKKFHSDSSSLKRILFLKHFLKLQKNFVSQFCPVNQQNVNDENFIARYILLH